MYMYAMTCMEPASGRWHTDGLSESKPQPRLNTDNPEVQQPQSLKL